MEVDIDDALELFPNFIGYEGDAPSHIDEYDNLKPLPGYESVWNGEKPHWIEVLQKKYELQIHHRKYNVFLSYPSKNIHNKSKTNDFFDECIMKIYVWLFISHYYSKQDCSKTMNINIYFSSHKKIIDSGVVLDSLHVNSAFTTSCKQDTQLCLYRKEEWFKVFIHETFHNLGFDFSDANETDLNRFMGQLFQVDGNNDLRIYETYCEVWAEILNCFFLSFFQCEDKNECRKMFYNTLKKQIIFCVKPKGQPSSSSGICIVF